MNADSGVEAENPDAMETYIHELSNELRKRREETIEDQLEYARDRGWLQ